MKKAFLHAIGPLLGLALFTVALWVLHRILDEYRYEDIVLYLKSLPAPSIALALGLTGLAYLNLTFYDLLAMRYIRHPLPWRKVGFASFITYAFSNTIGLSVLISGSVRYRLYSAWGLSAVDITKVVIFSTATFWLGILTIGGSTLTFDPLALPPLAYLPLDNTRALGLLMLTGPVLYLLLGLVRQEPFRLRNWELRVVRPRLGLAQLLVGALDWVLAGSVLYILLPGGDDTLHFAYFLEVFLLAQVVGLISHVPGGLGVFESVILILLSAHVPPADVLGALLGYRLVYYLLPLILATLSLGVHEALRHKERVLWLPRMVGAWIPVLLPHVLAMMTLVSGAVLLFSTATPTAAARLIWLQGIVPLPVLELSHFLGSLVGTGLLLLARGLQRRLDAAYALTAALLAAGIALCLLKGVDYEEAAMLALLLAALLSCRRYFYRRASLFGERFSAGWAATVVLVLICALWLGLFSYKHVEYSDELWWQFSFTPAGGAPRFLRAMVGAAALALLFALARLLRPALFEPARPSPSELAQAQAVIADCGLTYAHLALLGDKALLLNQTRTAFIMYGVEGRSWVAMGDPVGPADARRELAWEFRELCERHDTWTVFYQVRPADLDLYLEMGLTLLKIGEEARVPVAEFNLEGKGRKGMRTTVHRLEREGCEFEIVPPQAVPAWLPRLKLISDAWLGGKSTREKGFSLGFFNEDYLKACPVAVVRHQGEAVAFANLLLGSGKEEFSVDLMRHLPDAPKDVMDYLFVQLILWGRQQGYGWFNLGMAPLAGLSNRSLAPLWDRFGSLVFGHGERFYNFRGVRQYKDKFGPRWEPRYLASPGGIALPHILANVTALIAGGLKGVIGK